MDLASARLRLSRGREHLDELNDLCDQVCEDYADKLRAFYPHSVLGGDGLMALFDLIHPVEKIPPKVAILVGEAVYNFRASLDYLVGALAVTNGRAAEHRRRTQFPIESTAEGFAARRHSFLEGISDAHISIIRAYQPFAGCQWTARLAELSNLDKHNALVIVAQGIQIEVHESTGAGRHRVSVSPYLRFEQGGDVGDEVRELGDNVENALARFA